MGVLFTLITSRDRFPVQVIAVWYVDLGNKRVKL